ncbi:MAG: hypothetical protein L0323_01590 [Planctomycetes bacterium]|nr:hypothetical protein [Planctomycetota bacterium]
MGTDGRDRVAGRGERLLLPLAGALLALFLHGYRFAVADQDIYLPLVHAREAPEGFHPNDLLFRADVAGYSLFWWGVTKVQAWVDLPWLFLLGYAVLLYLYLCAVGSVCRALGLGREATALATLFASGPFPVGGDFADPAAAPIQTWDLYLTHRTLAGVLSWTSLAQALRGRWIPALGLAGCVVSVHPVSAAPLLAALAAAGLADGAHRRKEGWIGAALLLLGMVPFGLLRRGESSAGSLLAAVDPEWLEVLHLRNPYAFPSRWTPSAYAILALLGAAVLALGRSGDPAGPGIARRARACVAGILLACAGAFVFVDLRPIAGVVQFQVFRGLGFPILLGAFLVAGGLDRALRGAPALRAAAGWTAASLVWFDERLLAVGLLALLALRGRDGLRSDRAAWVAFAASVLVLAFSSPAEGLARAVPKSRLALAFLAALAGAVGPSLLRRIPVGETGPIALGGSVLLLAGLGAAVARRGGESRFDLPGRAPSDPWERTQAWARRQPGRALYVVPPDRSGFRTGSGRSAFVTFKDGGAALLDREFALEWSSRMRAVRGLPGGAGYPSLGPGEFEDLARRTGATHAIVEGGLPFEEVHRDGPIAVYRLPEAR